MTFAAATHTSRIEGICTVGEDEGCAGDAYCYGGENAKTGSSGICALRGLSVKESAPAEEEPPLPPPPPPLPPSPPKCVAQVEGLSPNAVSAPLATTNGRLLFGTSLGDTEANSSLYVFDTTACALLGSLHTGAVQGPMVALGGDALVALALGRGGPAGRNTPCLALVDVEGAKLGFIYDNSSMDCAAGVGGSSANAVFDKGLFLVKRGNKYGVDNWRLGAPANAGNASFLVAYEPHTSTTARRCNTATCGCWGDTTRDTGAPISPFLLTPVQGIGLDNLKDFITIHETTSTWARSWFFCETCLDWDLWHNEELQTFRNPSGLAGGGIVNDREQMWLSGNGLQRIYWSEKPEVVLGEHWRTSPAAIDGTGRAYVVVQTGAQSHELQRFANNIAQGEARECVVGDDSPCRNWQGCMGIGSQAEGFS